MARPVRILTVCLGNICRSPFAEAAIRAAAEAADVAVEVDSAGTGGWHVGAPPDHRSIAAGERVGLEVDGAARRLEPHDLHAHDLVLPMDEANLAHVEELRSANGGDATVRLLRSFDPHADDHEVGDPYYGGRAGFDRMAAEIMAAADGVVAWAEHHSRRGHADTIG